VYYANKDNYTLVIVPAIINDNFCYVHFHKKKYRTLLLNRLLNTLNIKISFIKYIIHAMFCIIYAIVIVIVSGLATYWLYL